MISKKSTIFFSFFICAASSVLFGLKYSVMKIEDRISKAKREITIEKKSNHILKAEWKTLTTPERIQRLATKYLTMRPIELNQLKEYDSSFFFDHLKKKERGTKKLSKLISQILSDSDGEE